MPRGVYKRKEETPEAPASIVVHTVSALSWFTKLNKDEQSAVTREGEALAQALLQYGRAKLAVGEHLTKLQGILEPHNLFQRFLKHYNFNKRTAYRYIASFKIAQARLPEVILKTAISRNIDLIGSNETQPFGRFTSAVEKLPPPQNPTQDQANTWLNQVEQVRKDTRTAETGAQAGGLFLAVNADPQVMLKECYRYVNLRYRRLPNNAKTKANWVRSLVGMILSDMGIAGQQSFAPITIPEDYKALRGRPATAGAPA